MNEIIIDGTKSPMGRVASYSAKQILLGNKVIIINCNEVIISGGKTDVIDKFKKKVAMGGYSLKGPTVIRNPERIMKRAVRGMMKHKSGRGAEAMKKIRCYNETPSEYKDKESIKIKSNKSQKFINLKELTERLK
jgi:large subunit ribosomal protein L13